MSWLDFLTHIVVKRGYFTKEQKDYLARWFVSEKQVTYGWVGSKYTALPDWATRLFPRLQGEFGTRFTTVRLMKKGRTQLDGFKTMGIIGTYSAKITEDDTSFLVDAEPRDLVIVKQPFSKTFDIEANSPFIVLSDG